MATDIEAAAATAAANLRSYADAKELSDRYMQDAGDVAMLRSAAEAIDRLASENAELRESFDRSFVRAANMEEAAKVNNHIAIERQKVINSLRERLSISENLEVLTEISVLQGQVAEARGLLRAMIYLTHRREPGIIGA